MAVMDHDGRVVKKGKVTDDLAGLARFHEMVGEVAEDSAEVLVGIETDRGLFVGALVAAGYQVYAVNPFAAAPIRGGSLPRAVLQLTGEV